MSVETPHGPAFSGDLPWDQVGTTVETAQVIESLPSHPVLAEVHTVEDHYDQMKEYGQEVAALIGELDGLNMGFLQQLVLRVNQAKQTSKDVEEFFKSLGEDGFYSGLKSFMDEVQALHDEHYQVRFNLAEAFEQQPLVVVEMEATAREATQRELQVAEAEAKREAAKEAVTAEEAANRKAFSDSIDLKEITKPPTSPEEMERLEEFRRYGALSLGHPEPVSEATLAKLEAACTNVAGARKLQVAAKDAATAAMQRFIEVNSDFVTNRARNEELIQDNPRLVAECDRLVLLLTQKQEELDTLIRASQTAQLAVRKVKFPTEIPIDKDAPNSSMVPVPYPDFFRSWSERKQAILQEPADALRANVENEMPEQAPVQTVAAVDVEVEEWDILDDTSEAARSDNFSKAS